MINRRASWATVVALLLPLPVLAQAVGAFDRLGERLDAGEVVRVVDWSGRTVSGRLATLSADQLVLDRGGARQVLTRTDVREVSHREHDPLRNGVLIGFAAAAGSYCALALSVGTARGCGVPAVLIGGLGAPIGALIDAAITRRVVVFRAADRTVTMTAALTRGGRGGARVAVRASWHRQRGG